MRRVRAVRVVAVGALVAALAACAPASPPQPSITSPAPSLGSSSPAPTVTPSPAETRIDIAAMGDMLPHETIVDGAVVPGGYDFAQYFADIRPGYADADLVFCNQEAPSAAGVGIQYYPAFNAPTQFAHGLHDGAGCTAIGLANNHLYDVGQAGIDGTRAVWSEIGPRLISGASSSAEQQREVSVTEVEGVRVAFVAFTDLTNRAAPATSLNMLTDTALVRELMGLARAAADVVVVQAHWGVEYAPAASATQRAQAAMLVELGADVILGSGPHVLQSAEWLPQADGGRALVWYSLGNMLSSQIAIPRVFSAVGQFSIVRDAAGSISIEDPRAFPTYMHFDWTREDARVERLETRANPHLYPLAAAAEPLTRSAWATTVEEQYAAIAAALGPEVRIER